jgi:xanthine/CO dehydrogenase XdhC/CoxF family maturation factor
MNHWKESAEILRRLGELPADRRAAIATVVRIAGSAYRRPGAKLLLEDSGDTLGSVSGGCLEADVREVAVTVLDTGTPSLRHYDTGGGDTIWGLGLGCNGSVDVNIQPASRGPLAELAGCLRRLFAGDAPFALLTVLAAPEGAGAMLLVEAAGAVHGTLGAADLDRLGVEAAHAALTAGHPEVRTLAGCEVFVDVMPPPPHLIVCGGGDDARPLVAYAADVGFRVSLLDHRPALIEEKWFPQAARRVQARPEAPDVELPAADRSLAVVKTHSLGHDREWVRRLLAAGVPYIGLLGPRARTESILQELGVDPCAAASHTVFGPVGLDIGADGPRQVAISIVSELLAFLAKRQPGHLSERREPIHVG